MSATRSPQTLPPAPTVRRSRRSYSAAVRNRINGDWTDSRLNAAREIRDALELLRSNAREAERNDPLYSRALSLLVTGIVGSRGFLLKSLTSRPDGRSDDVAASILERHWRAWAGSRVTIDGRLDWMGALQLAVRSWLRDGEVFVRLLYRDGRPVLQVLEGDMVPVRLDDPERGIVSGIELDASGAPLAYHIATRHPGEHGYGIASQPDTVRVPADEIVHLFLPERPGQVRGVPAGAAAMDQLRLLRGYQEAELSAARMNASRPMTIEQVEAESQYLGDGTGEDGDEEKPIEIDMAPGGATMLPHGFRVVYNPAQHPAGAFEPFVRQCIRSFATAMGLSYAVLSRDLSSVNYSSLRIENQHQARHFETLQRHVVETLVRPVWEHVLRTDVMRGAIGSGRIVLRASDLERHRQARWIAQPHPIVERQDIEEARERIRLGVSTLTRECLKLTGCELDEIVAERKAERELLAAHGLVDVLEQDATAAQINATEQEEVEHEAL